MMTQNWNQIGKLKIKELEEFVKFDIKDGKIKVKL